MSLCISVTRVLRHWPAPINQPCWLLGLLPTSPRSALSPLLWLFLPLSPHLFSLPACLCLVFHSSGAPQLHCGCQSAGRREESEMALSLACLRPCGHEVLPKDSNQVSSCILVTPCLPFCLQQIASTIFKQRMVWITLLCESSTFSTCQGSLKSFFILFLSAISLSPFHHMCVRVSLYHFLPSSMKWKWIFSGQWQIWQKQNFRLRTVLHSITF